MRRIILAAIFTALAGAARAQAWLDQPGVAGTTVADLGEARIKLPPGDWKKLSDSSSLYHAQTVPEVESVYIQTDGKRVVALAWVDGNGSASAFRKGYRPTGSCFRNDVFLNDSNNLYPGQWDCLIVNHSMMTWTDSVPALWQKALDAMQPYGGVPRPMPYVQLAMASPSRNGYAVLQIMVNAEVSGFSSNPKATWNQSEWHKNNATPDRVAFLKKLAVWGEAYRPIFRNSWE
jgi:hypothetical protein